MSDPNESALQWFTNHTEAIEKVSQEIASTLENVDLHIEMSFRKIRLSGTVVPTLILSVKGKVGMDEINIPFKVCYEPAVSMVNIQIYEKPHKEFMFLDTVPFGGYDQDTLHNLIRTLFSWAVKIVKNL